MSVQRRTKRRVIETEELILETPCGMSELQDAIAEVLTAAKNGKTIASVRVGHFMEPSKPGAADYVPVGIAFTWETECDAEESTAATRIAKMVGEGLEVAQRGVEPPAPRTTPAPTKKAPAKKAPAKKAAATRSDLGPHAFEGTELVPGYCKHCGYANEAGNHVEESEGDPFPRAPRTTGLPELTNEVADRVLLTPGTWYFHMANPKDKGAREKDRNRLRLRLHRARNRLEQQGKQVLFETKMVKDLPALEVTVVH
jgi:hypothetical protein